MSIYRNGLPPASTELVAGALSGPGIEKRFGRSGKAARMNTADYDPDIDGAIISGPNIRPNTAGLPVVPNFDPKLDAEGREIAKQPSRMLRLSRVHWPTDVVGGWILTAGWL